LRDAVAGGLPSGFGPAGQMRKVAAHGLVLRTIDDYRLALAVLRVRAEADAQGLEQARRNGVQANATPTPHHATISDYVMALSPVLNMAVGTDHKTRLVGRGEFVAQQDQAETTVSIPRST
jgi:hypothetical protein